MPDRGQLPDQDAPAVCDDCREVIAEYRPQFDLPTEAALHIAVGVLHGGWACDHVDWDDEDAWRAYEALYHREMRWRDRLRAENEKLRTRLNAWPADPCGCRRTCGDDGDIDGPGTCKGLPPTREPSVEFVVKSRLGSDDEQDGGPDAT